jgi:lipoprotein-anchoring transpeptidase ErfK/SrfK
MVSTGFLAAALTAGGIYLFLVRPGVTRIVPQEKPPPAPSGAGGGLRHAQDPAPPREPAPPADTQSDPAEVAFLDVRRLVESRAWSEARGAIARLLQQNLPQARLETLLEWGRRANEALVFGDPPAEDIVAYRVRQGETLTTIARRHRTTIGAIKYVNGMTSDLLRADQVLRIPRGTFSILAVKRLFRLYVLYEGVPLDSYPIAIGTEDRTPVGEYTVGPKTPDPTWYVPPNLQREQGLPPVVRPGDPRNPLGSHWITLVHPRIQGLGIHGTNDDRVIGSRATYGCIRLRNEDVSRLFDLVSEGMRVRITD